jgi:hypothetical protein
MHSDGSLQQPLFEGPQFAEARMMQRASRELRGARPALVIDRKARELSVAEKHRDCDARDTDLAEEEGAL